jgi:hypothetical protein
MDSSSTKLLDSARNDKIENRQSVPPAHVARQDIQLGAIFCDGSTRDWNAAVAQDLDDLFVTQRRATVFVLH